MRPWCPSNSQPAPEVSLKRREFIEGIAATGLLSSAAGDILQAASTAEIPRRALGHTGERVSMVGLGGYHIGVQKTEDESIRIIRTALDSGINFLDNCWDYDGGTGEVRMGKAVRDGYRKKPSS